MSAAILALLPVLIPYGAQAIAQLIAMFSKSTPPSDADWQALMALTSKTARQQMLEVLAAHGIDPNSPQGQALLALTP
jgi:hypothetical protein